MEFRGDVGFVFHSKLKALKGKIKEWVIVDLSKVEEKIVKLETLLEGSEINEEERPLSQFELEVNHMAGLDLRDATK